MRILSAKCDYFLNRFHPASSHCVESNQSDAHAKAINYNPGAKFHLTLLILLLCTFLRNSDQHAEQVVTNLDYHRITGQLVKLCLQFLVDDLCTNELLFRGATLTNQLVGHLPCLCRALKES